MWRSNATRAEARPIGHEQPRDVLVRLGADAELGGLRGDRPEDGASGEVAGVAGATPAVRTEVALVERAFRRPRELAAPVGQLEHRSWRLAREDLDHPGIPEEVALAHRVGEVLLPGVLGVARAERGVDAAGGEDRVGVERRPLAEDAHLDAGLGGRDRGAPASRARADDQDVGRLGSVHGVRDDRCDSGCQPCIRSVIRTREPLIRSVSSRAFAAGLP